MRELKFRAWDTKEQQMYPYLKSIEWWESTSGLLMRPTVPGKDPLSTDLVLMQYTGLKDKHGTAVYEGDILGFENPELSPEQVVWRDGKFQVSDYEFSNDLSMWLADDDDLPYVIGNIYEHPALLEELKETG